MTRKCDHVRCIEAGETTVQYGTGETRAYCDCHLNHLIQMGLDPFFSTVRGRGEA